MCTKLCISKGRDKKGFPVGTTYAHSSSKYEAASGTMWGSRSNFAQEPLTLSQRDDIM